MAALTETGSARPDHPLDDEELRALLLLRQMPGVGDRTLSRRLLAHPATRLLREARSFGSRAAAALRDAEVQRRADSALAAVRRDGVTVWSPRHTSYPQDLLQLYDPPPLLFLRGDLSLLDAPAVAMVGTRGASHDGVLMAERLAAAVAGAGGVVVSGLALGIDGAAHRAAMPRTIAVLANGLDVRYPRRHARLQRTMAEASLLVTEFPHGTPPLRHHFPQRNRIIAGLAKTLVVVEAPARSGALITVEHAQDLGRDVMAVSGPPGRESCRGSNELVRDGALIVAEPADVLFAMGLCTAVGQPLALPADLPPDVRRVGEALDGEPRTTEQLCAATGLAVPAVLGALLELELRGVGRRMPGPRFVRG